jgi:hypothetical protein
MAAYIDLPRICAQPKDKLRSVAMFKRSELAHVNLKYFETCTVGRAFSISVELNYSRDQTPINIFPVICSIFQDVPAKLSRIAKQHPSNSAHLMRRLCGVF